MAAAEEPERHFKEIQRANDESRQRLDEIIKAGAESRRRLYVAIERVKGAAAPRSGT